MSNLTHFDDKGAAHMVDVGKKNSTQRVAVAEAFVVMRDKTLALILNKDMSKGDVCQVARLAGIMAAKKTADLIPLCHPLALTSISVDFNPLPDISTLHITSTVKLYGQTGVEMEALTAVSVAALTVYDMCKAIDRGMELKNIRLCHKSGGKSGAYDFVHAVS